MDRKIIDDLEHEAYEAERLEHALPVKEQADNLLEEKEGNSGILVDPNSLGQLCSGKRCWAGQGSGTLSNWL
mgnify:CR=1 FL=1